MNLLNRYLFNQFFRNFLTVAAAFISIYLLIDFFEKFDDFSSAGKPLSMVFTYFLFTIPSIIDLLGPVFILLAGVITLGILNHSHELTALKAGGLPLQLIITPLLAGAILFTTLFIASSQWLLPITVAKTNHIWYEQIKGKVPLGIVRKNRYYYKGEEGFYSFNWHNPKQYFFHNFSYSTWDKEYNLNEMISAQFAFWQETTSTWVLQNGQIQHQKEGKYEIIDFQKRIFSFKEKPTDFLVPVNKTAEYSLSDLYWEVERAETEQEKQIAWTTFTGRISYLLLGIPLLLLGLPFLLHSYGKWGKDLSVAILVSCGLAFFAWGIWGALQSLAITGYISPFIAAGGLHFVFLAIGLHFLRKTDQ